MSLPFDMNTYTHTIAAQSEGHVYSLASLNTTHDVWEDHRESEMEHLATFLTKSEVLGVKIAPPHTCLPLQSPAMDDVVEVVSKATRAKVIAIHIGTTPFCGPLGEQFNIVTCCGREYVDPELLVPKIKAHPDITFVLLHAGHEFLPPESPFYYNFEFVDKSIALAAEYPNVWISLSAMFAQNPDKSFKYPGGLENAKKFKQAGVLHKLLWGSDASYVQGQIREALLESIKAMVWAGFSPSERCWALNGAARKVFAIPSSNDTEQCIATSA
jgi:predicted TIM-barrel fold metal-dependent hydrolase